MLVLGGANAARLLPHGRIKDLSEVEFSVSSQWGEDGIIEWLVRTVTPYCERFVEFGVENFDESNCRFLMQHRNWQGFVIDGSADHIKHLEAQAYFWMHHLVAKNAFVTAENINSLIVDAGFSGSLGILSIDLDGNDYWVWKAIDSCNPDILICEYNGLFGDILPITIPYDPKFDRFKARYCGQYFGASLPALDCLAKERGYTFVGTNRNGINAFYVKNSKSASVLELLESRKGFPKLLRVSRNRSGDLAFSKNVREIVAMIGDLPVINVETGEKITLKELDNLYSEEWEKYLFRSEV